MDLATLHLDIRGVRRRGIGAGVAHKAILVGPKHPWNGSAEFAGVAEVQSKAPLPVEPLGGVDVSGVLAPGGESREQDVELDASGMDVLLHVLPAPAVQLVTQERPERNRHMERGLGRRA